MEDENVTQFNNISQFNVSDGLYISTIIHEEYPSFEWTLLNTIKLLIYGPIVLGTILGNYLALFAFFTRRRQMRSPPHYFIANLALSDFLVGILCLPFLSVYSITDRWYFGPESCYAYMVLHFWLCSISIYSTCSICIDIYIGVEYPIQHSTIFSMNHVGWIVMALWTYGGIIALASLFVWPLILSSKEYECKINQQKGHAILATLGILYIPASIMIILYWRIYRIVTKQSEIINSFNAGVEYSSISTHSTADEQVSDAKNSHIPEKCKVEQSSTVTSRSAAASRKKHIHLAKRIVFLVGIVLISYIPYFTVILIGAFHPDAVSADVFNILKWIRYFNSCINPLIYAFAVPAYKKAFESIMKGIMSRTIIR